MDFEHNVIHKDMEWHSAFPEIIRLQNGEMVCVFRQAPGRVSTGSATRASRTSTRTIAREQPWFARWTTA